MLIKKHTLILNTLISIEEYIYSCGENTRITLGENEYRNLKSITKYATWSINNVLMTDNHDLSLDKVIINEFMKDIGLKIFYAFGKISDIINNM